MATSKRNVELGTVGFNLEANDASLLRSLETLKKYGEQVNRASNATDDAGRSIYNTMARVERSLTSTFDKVSALTDNMKKVGVSSEHVKKLATEYDALVNAMTKASGGTETHEFVRAQVALGAATAQATRSLKEQDAIASATVQRRNAIASATEKVANATSRLKLQGATDGELSKLSTLLDSFRARANRASSDVTKLKEAQRLFTSELGNTTRAIRENVAQANLAERQQTRLLSATRNVAYLNARIIRNGLPNSMASTNSSALEGFAGALQGGNHSSILSAQQKLNDAMMSTRIAMAGAEKPVSALSVAMHDLSKATVLALGPLSGVGARISILTSLFDSNSVKAALFIGGVVAAGAALFHLSSAAIKAAVDQQKFNALLTTSTGSVTLVVKEYEYLLNTSNRLGASVRNLVKPYADFSSAARLSGLSLEQQRKIFESVMTTSSALRWNEEQLGRAFLAITQMISKTTVMSEEYKKQLGELIPNVIGLGAAAEQTSTKGFMSMMKNSTLLTNDHLPKLADKLNAVFGPGAAEGAKSITAETFRLSNATFEALKAFDQVTGISKVWAEGLIAVTKGVLWLKENMNQLVAVLVAVAGAGAGVLFAKLLMSLPAIIAAVNAGIIALVGGVTGLRVALMALQASTIVGWLITLTGAVLGAAAAYGYFTDKTAEAGRSGAQINEQVKGWIKQQEELGRTQQQVRDQMKQQAVERLTLLSSQIGAETRALRTLENAYKPKEGTSWFLPKPKAAAAMVDDPRVVEARNRVFELNKEYQDLTALIEKMDTLKLEPKPTSGVEGDKNSKWDSWFDRLNKHIADSTGKLKELNALKLGGEEAQKLTIAMNKAKELLADMPSKGADLVQLRKRLLDAGFAGETLEKQLTAVFLQEEKAADGIKDFNEKLQNQKTAADALSESWEKLNSRKMAINGEVAGIGPEEANSAKQLNEQLRKMRENLEILGAGEEQITTLLKMYSDEWKNISGLEKHQKDIERVSAALERMGLKIGDQEARMRAQADAQVAIIQEAIQLRLLTEEAAATEINRIYDDLNRKLLKGGTEFYKKMQDIFNRLEDSITNALVDGLSGAKNSFKDLLGAMFREVMAFIIRMAIVKPMMENLFGDLFTGKSNGSNGILGDIILGAMKFFGAPTGSSGGGSDVNSFASDVYNAGVWEPGPLSGLAGGGLANPYTWYEVGENGPELLRIGHHGATVMSNQRSQGVMGSGGYQDNSRHTTYIDGRADVAHTMQLLRRSSQENAKQLERALKVRYG